VGKFASLEVEEDEAFKQIVVENEVEVEVLRFRADALLARDEGKALAEFEEERLEIADESVFKFSFEQFADVRQAEEFQHDGIVDELPRGDR
jgi:hypothetical protein